jgi:hypothetical protein
MDRPPRIKPGTPSLPRRHWSGRLQNSNPIQPRWPVAFISVIRYNKRNKPKGAGMLTSTRGFQSSIHLCQNPNSTGPESCSHWQRKQRLASPPPATTQQRPATFHQHLGLNHHEQRSLACCRRPRRFLAPGWLWHLLDRAAVFLKPSPFLPRRVLVRPNPLRFQPIG